MKVAKNFTAVARVLGPAKKEAAFWWWMGERRESG
jgi:hypothetical protein